ncbi:GNAT family N-acetyltransferase [Salsuginibacillus kocurii]|uniref:GNAT family N-acetyltransferase n=1 Tax=Salsuginibacillus kocurii TaxID=427078 RepID=UPI00036472BF|nr:GNAT family protein [Salsuginibacillus kocurii]
MFTIKVDDELELCLLDQRHVHELFLLIDESRAFLSQWLPWVDEIETPADYRNLLEFWQYEWLRGTGFQVGIQKDGFITGVIGVAEVNARTRTCSVGFWMAERYTGQRIMKRALIRLTEVLFAEYGIERIELKCAEDNQASLHLAKSCHFVEEGRLRQAERLADGSRDLILHSLLKSDHAEELL